MKFKLNRKKVGAALGAAALLATGTGIAVAAIPDSGDAEFHACVANTGPVRAIYMIDKDASESCATGYTEKTWPGASNPATAATWTTVTATETCGQSAPFNRTKLVSLPSNKRGLHAWVPFSAPTTDLYSQIVNSSGQTVDPQGPDAYHYDSSGRIDGVYLQAFADGSVQCPSSGSTLTYKAKMFVYDVS